MYVVHTCIHVHHVHVNVMYMCRWYVCTIVHVNAICTKLLYTITVFFTIVCSLTIRSQLQDIQDRLEKEGMSKKDIIHELEVLKEKHQNEVIAREHARKLNK